MRQDFPPHLADPRLTLRIVTWNCRGKFRAKWTQLAALHPDLAVVQECEDVAKWPDIGATSVYRTGSSPHKGLAVMAFGDWRLSPAGEPPADLRYFLPVRVAGRVEFNLLGVWAMGTCELGHAYIEQVRAAAMRMRTWLADAPCVVAGDLNASAIWDRPEKGRTPFQETVELLDGVGLVSAYHAHGNEPFGAEREMTYRSPVRRDYHLDYCFVPQSWSICQAGVGGTEWLAASDHRPVMVDVGV